MCSRTPWIGFDVTAIRAEHGVALALLFDTPFVHLCSTQSIHCKVGVTSPMPLTTLICSKLLSTAITPRAKHNTPSLHQPNHPSRSPAHAHSPQHSSSNAGVTKHSKTS